MLAEAQPAVTSCVVGMARPTLEDLRGDDQRLCEAVAEASGVDAAVSDLGVARDATAELRKLDWQARGTPRGSEVIHVAAADAPGWGWRWTSARPRSPRTS